jgi:hypothetical protein
MRLNVYNMPKQTSNLEQEIDYIPVNLQLGSALFRYELNK